VLEQGVDTQINLPCQIGPPFLSDRQTTSPSPSDTMSPRPEQPGSAANGSSPRGSWSNAHHHPTLPPRPTVSTSPSHRVHPSRSRPFQRITPAPREANLPNRPPTLTEEQVRAIMAEDDDFDPVPVEHRSNFPAQTFPTGPPAAAAPPNNMMHGYPYTPPIPNPELYVNGQGQTLLQHQQQHPPMAMSPGMSPQQQYPYQFLATGMSRGISPQDLQQRAPMGMSPGMSPQELQQRAPMGMNPGMGGYHNPAQFTGPRMATYGYGQPWRSPELPTQGQGRGQGGQGRGRGQNQEQSPGRQIQSPHHHHNQTTGPYQ
jgi:hypothetical protein